VSVISDAIVKGVYTDDIAIDNCTFF